MGDDTGLEGLLGELSHGVGRAQHRRCAGEARVASPLPCSPASSKMALSYDSGCLHVPGSCMLSVTPGERAQEGPLCSASREAPWWLPLSGSQFLSRVLPTVLCLGFQLSAALDKGFRANRCLRTPIVSRVLRAPLS